MAADVSVRREERHKMMLEQPVAKVIPIVAVPMIISMLIDSLYNLADTYFVSQIGIAATAAVAVNGSLAHLLRSVAMGFGMGSSSYVSRLLGAKKDEKACCVATTALFSSMFTLILIAALAFVFVDPIVDLLGSTASSKPYSIEYARIILLSAPFTAGEVALSQSLRAEGSTKYSMIGMVSGCVINVILDPVLIYWFDMGVAGAAAATTISKAVSFVILILPFLRGKTMLLIKARYFTPSREIYGEIARMGIPTFLRSSMMAISGVVTNQIAGSFSDAALAAVSIANKCTRIVGSAILGFGQGFQPVAGYCWGARRYRRVREAFWVSSGIGVAAAVILGGVLALLAPKLVNMFVNEGESLEIIRIGSLMIRTQCYAMAAHVWVMIINGLFQALGRGLQAGFLGLSRQVICLIPVLVLLSHFFGVDGLAISQAVADVLSLILAVLLVIPLLKELHRRQQNEKGETND